MRLFRERPLVLLLNGLPSLFILVAAPTLVFFALFVPPGEVPDEVAHILRADSVRHGQIAGFRRPWVDKQGDPAVDVAVRADMGLLAAGFAFTPGTPLASKHVTRTHLERLQALPWANRLEPVSVPNTAVYPPLLYVPSAAGMQAAKWMGHGPYDAILGGRLANALAYILLGVAALGVARRGRAVLFGVLCLPMSLSLAASVNQDGLVIACAGLAGALLTQQRRFAWWSGVVVFCLAAMAKPYLLPLACLVPATVPGRLRGNMRSVAAGFAVAVTPALAWALAMGLLVAAPFVRGPAQLAGPLWAGPAGTLFATTNPGEQLRILLASPDHLITLPMQSAWSKGEWLWREALGVLGTLDVILPLQSYDVWGWALAVAVLAGLVASRKREPQDEGGLVTSILALFGALAAGWAIYVLQYLSWTRVGEVLVDGVQGRYFLPIAALALPVALLPLFRLPAATVVRASLSLPVAVVAVTGLASLPALVLATYYVR